VAIATPAAAGPRIRAEWMSTLLSPTALTTRLEPTISMTKLCRLGLSNALTAPRAKTSAKTIHGSTAPPAVTAHSTSAGSAISAWVTISRRRLSTRSARAPPHAPASSIGRNCSAVVIPTATPLPVSERISQTSATTCIQFPLSETSCPAK
jgi:hypothetical protein